MRSMSDFPEFYSEREKLEKWKLKNGGDKFNLPTLSKSNSSHCNILLINCH
jgi:hypothetical protein